MKRTIKTAKQRRQREVKGRSLRAKGEPQKYRLLIENIRDIVYSADARGIVDYVTPQVNRYGFKPEEIVSKSLLDFIFPEDREKVALDYGKTITTGQEFFTEFRMKDKEGHIHWFEENGKVQRDKAGKTIRVVGVLRDVTERKLMEDELRHLEERYQASLDSMLEGCQMIGFDWKYLYVNDAVARHGRHAREELLGHTMMEVYPGIENTELFTVLRRCMESRVSHRMENKFTFPDGSEGWFKLSIYPVPEGIFILSIDITERKRMEEEIEYLAKFPSENPNPILRLSQDGIVLHVNKASEPLLQSWGCKVGGKAPKFIQDTVTEALSNQSDRSLEIPFGKQTYLFYVRPVKNTNYVNFYGRDITDRRQAEDELKRYTDRLEDLVEERTAEIRRLNESVTERLFQKMRQIENVCMLREGLKKTPDVSTGLAQILDMALSDFNADIGAVLVVNRDKNVVNLRSLKSKMEGVQTSESYPLNERFAELEAIRDDKSISKTVERDKESILKTATVHCAPIHIGNEVYGVLCLGTRENMALDKNDLAVLGLYASVTSSVFEMQRLSLTPIKETVQAGKRQFELEFGSSYIIKNDVEKAYEIFADNVFSGLEGLCITRKFPPKVREKYRLEKTPIIWLTDEKAQDQATVHSLQDLSILINNFLEKTSHAIVLLDGFEYLITNQGFEPFIRFLQLSRSRCEQHDSILIAPLLESSLALREAKLIERETKPLIIQ